MFWKEKQGLCAKCQNLVDENDGCECYILKKNKKIVTVQELDTAIKDINEIKKFGG